jgi:hypothetical protein
LRKCHKFLLFFLLFLLIRRHAIIELILLKLSTVYHILMFKLDIVLVLIQISIIINWLCSSSAQTHIRFLALPDVNFRNFNTRNVWVLNVWDKETAKVLIELFRRINSRAMSIWVYIGFKPRSTLRDSTLKL